MKWRGDRLEQARTKAGMSRADLAAKIRHVSGERIRTNERGITGWERSVLKRGPGGETVCCLARIFGVDVDFFYEAGGDDGELDEEAAQVTDALLERLVEKRLQQRLRELGVGGAAR